MTKIFLLLILFQIKHFIADFPLQTKFMLGKFSGDRKVWLPALSAHAAVHSGFTFLIAVAGLWHVAGTGSLIAPFALALLDFVLHFMMDRIKASGKLLGRYKALSPSEYQAVEANSKYEGENSELLMFKKLCIQKLRGNTLFWWALGLDQMVHHLTHYLIIYILICV